MTAAPARRNREEAMDQPGLDPDLLAEDLRNLAALNRLFGGRQVIRRRVLPLLARLPAGREARVVDIGSGAGDLCREVVDGCRAQGRPVRLLSVDFHPQVQAYAREELRDYPEVRFVRGDGRRLPLPDGAADLSLCTLALHHFTEADAAAVLSELRRVTRRWAVVSDLRRGYTAYAAVWAATRPVRNPMTRHDGPTSVLRAFTPAELRGLAEAAGWSGFRAYTEAWFRQTLVYEGEAPW